MKVALKNRKQKASFLKNIGMRKTFVDIEKVSSFNSLYRAWQQVSAGDKGERKDVIKYGQNLTANLRSLSKKLLSEEWEPDTGRAFKIMSEGKLRDIHVVGVEDRIVHQAINYHLGKALLKMFVNRTYGSIKGRGTLKASKQVRKDLKRNYPYVIKLDARKYYDSISKQKLKELTERKIRGGAVLRLNNKIIDAFKIESLTGISIGSLPSQNNGNWYLTVFDYFCMQELGCSCYVRYVDDIVIQCESKEKAADWIPRIKEWLKSNLGIELGRIELFPIDSRKIDFCMYQTDRDGVMIRRRVLERFIRKLRDLTKSPREPEYERNCVCSYLGFLKFCNSYNLIKKLRNEYSEVFNRVDGMSSRSKRKRVNITGSTAGNE